MELNTVLKLVAAIMISELAGVLGSVFTIRAIPDWYATLKNRKLNPPGWVFGPVWTILVSPYGHFRRFSFGRKG